MVSAPASNHPVPVSQPPNTQQMYSPSKSTTYTGGYQSNLSHSPNVLPPVTQTLPPTSQQPQTTSEPAAADSNKPQANGTPEKPPPKTNTEQQQQQNHVAKDKPVPSPVEKTPEKVAEVKEKTPEVVVQQQKSAVVTSSPQTNVSTNTATTAVAASAVAQEQQQQQNKLGGGSAQVASAVSATSPQAKPKEQVRNKFCVKTKHFLN